MNALPIALAGLGGYLIFDGGFANKPAKRPSLPTSDGQTSSKYAPLGGRTSLPFVNSLSSKTTSNATLLGGGIPKNPFLVPILRNGSASKNSKQTNGAAQQLLDKAHARAKSEYDGLTADAKKAGAGLLNKSLNPSPNLTGKESYEDAAKKIGAALGAAGGAALGAWIGGGAGSKIGGKAGAVLGAIVGAYLGKSLGPWMAGKWHDVESWSKNAAKDVESAAKKVGRDIEHDVDSAVDEIKSWF